MRAHLMDAPTPSWMLAARRGHARRGGWTKLDAKKWRENALQSFFRESAWIGRADSLSSSTRQRARGAGASGASRQVGRTWPQKGAVAGFGTIWQGGPRGVALRRGTVGRTWAQKGLLPVRFVNLLPVSCIG